MSPKSARSSGWRWPTNRFGTSVRSVVVRRSASIARSIRCWIWIGWRRARKSRAEGRSKRRSKNRSTAARGGMVGRGVYQRVPGSPVDRPDPPMTFGVRAGYGRLKGRSTPAIYSRPARTAWPPGRRPRELRGPDDRDPDRILLRTLWHPLHVRIRTAEDTADGGPGPVARPQELRHVRRHVDGRSDGRGAQRDGPRADGA